MTEKIVKETWKYFRPLISSALIMSGVCQLVLPVLANGTTAGTSISNTATATYEDTNNPGITINATSNTVVLTVAEVAGITVTAAGINDKNGGQVEVGDLLYYNYTITNVGNDPTQLRIPNLATVTGPGLVNADLEVSTDEGTTWTAINGVELLTNSVPPEDSLNVRVPVTVTNGAASGDIIRVKLGDTPNDDQNILRNPNNGDIYTVDNPDGSGISDEVDGTPINGVREASISQEIVVSNTIQNLALATLLKTRTNHNPANPAVLSDDILTYNLDLQIELNDPTNNGFTPAPLVGTSININGDTATHILVSDAIPVGTELTGTPVAPPGWQVVYTTESINIPANAANWTTTNPSAGVTRVGFINNYANVTSIAPGQTVTGFRFEVVTSLVTAETDIANIAQVFGQTSNEPTATLVYDESGDRNPNNFNDDGTLPLDSNGDGNPDVDDGLGDLALDGSDLGNNNTGTGPRGEPNLFTVASQPPASVLNGPNNSPNALGPTDNNNDFTNKSLVPTDSTIDPVGINFTNTIENNGTESGDITIEPTPLTNPADLPNATTVTVTAGTESATYIYNQTNNVFVIDPADTPIVVTNVLAWNRFNYSIEVDLPAETPLSTNTVPGYEGDKEFGFPVPITATLDTYSLDTNGDRTPDTPDDIPDANNTTINRVYTGFLKVTKESRVVQGTGRIVPADQQEFSNQERRPVSGNILEYRITYTNISTPEAGAGNVTLTAEQVVITEDSTNGINNWALDNNNDGLIDTSNIIGSAQDTNNSDITLFSGNPATQATKDQTGTAVDTDVTKYINIITNPVKPGEFGEFSFKRLVN